MPVTVICGGQYGSEGKGKVAQIVTSQLQARAAVRVGGTNSGHTGHTAQGHPRILRQLPTAALLSDVLCVIGPGSYVDPPLLLREIRDVGLPSDRLLIDPLASVITPDDKVREKPLRKSIGSTATGNGSALEHLIRRRGAPRFAGETKALAPWLTETTPVLQKLLDDGDRVVIEGTQGFGLSVRSRSWPYVTSRDTTAAGFVMEAGLSPLDVDDIVLVLRSFPIRVPGNSGELHNEVSWRTVTEESGSKVEISETTSVTRETRRVARFDPNIVRSAILRNRPTRLVLNHLDYVDDGCRRENRITKKARSFLESIEVAIGKEISLGGIAPKDLVPTRPESIKVA